MALIDNIINVFKYECLKVVKDRLYLTTLLVLPFVTILFFSIIFNSGVIEKLPIVVIDHDNTHLSRQVISMVSASPAIEISEYATSIDEAKAMMRRGRVYAILLLPEGLEQNTYGSRPSSIECYVSSTNLSASGIIEAAMQSTLQTFSSSISISTLLAEGLTMHESLLEIMPITINEYIISNPTINYGYYLSPFFMFTSLAIFTILVSIYAIGRELRYSTSREWLCHAKYNVTAATIGKLLPTTVIMFAYSQVILFIIFDIMGLKCHGSYILLALGTLLFILAYQAVAIVIISITSNMRLSLSLGGGYAVMAFTFSGITFPTGSMFTIADYLSNIFPLTWFGEIFIDQAMRGSSPTYSIPAFIYLAIFLFLPAVVMRRLRGISLIPKYWGRE